MGFDLHGINPNIIKEEPVMPSMDNGPWNSEEKDQYIRHSSWEEKNGIYFRNNVWAWHPLWDFVTNTCGDIITPKDARLGHDNSGHKISKRKAENIGKRLHKSIKDGFAVDYVKDRNIELESMPDLECDICAGTGYRQDPPKVGAGILKCNGCKTTGKVRPGVCSYYLDIGNIKDFADFCINSGGFSIC